MKSEECKIKGQLSVCNSVCVSICHRKFALHETKKLNFIIVYPILKIPLNGHLFCYTNEIKGKVTEIEMTNENTSLEGKLIQEIMKKGHGKS